MMMSVQEAIMQRYEVVQSRVWQRDDGRTASVYGALPWWGNEEKSHWAMVTRGWTIRDNQENTIGLGRVPFKTENEAIEHCAKLNERYEIRLT